jgi:cytochrome c553
MSAAVARHIVRAVIAFAAGCLPVPIALAAGDKELGEYLSSECVTCHQISGNFDGIPPIVGWPDAVFIEIMTDYRAKARPNPIMQTIAGRLSEEEIAALAAYFGSLTHTRRIK